MKMRGQYFILFLTMLLGMEFLSCRNETHPMNSGTTPAKIFTCPMHPQIIKEQPGDCPICGMRLVEKTDHGNAVDANDLTMLLKPTNTYVISTVKTIHPRLMEMQVTLTATGTVTYDLNQTNSVAARVAGRIDKLYIRYRYQPVLKGQKLADIYSKELLTEQENFIYLLENDVENRSLIAAARNRLLLQGLAPDEVASLETSRKPFGTVAIYSPYAGHLHELSSREPSTTESMAAMNADAPEALSVREGMYFQKGQTIFNIYDTKRVWVLLNVYPADAGKLKLGQKVTMSFDGINTAPVEAKIDFIEPVLRQGHQTITARAYTPNPKGILKIGTLAHAKVETGMETGLFIPSTALIHLGIQDVVMVSENAVFSAKPVQTGIKTEGWVKILAGVTEADEIAENAQLLMDSESFIQIEGGKNE